MELVLLLLLLLLLRILHEKNVTNQNRPTQIMIHDETYLLLVAVVGPRRRRCC